jgi:hypothetical protein
MFFHFPFSPLATAGRLFSRVAAQNRHVSPCRVTFRCLVFYPSQPKLCNGAKLSARKKSRPVKSIAERLF